MKNDINNKQHFIERNFIAIFLLLALFWGWVVYTSISFILWNYEFLTWQFYQKAILYIATFILIIMSLFFIFYIKNRMK
mgnify:CR=1 FL=1